MKNKQVTLSGTGFEKFSKTTRRAIHRAVQTLGGAKALADAFGVKPALVESWLARLRQTAPLI
jgi:hypothetical protein